MNNKEQLETAISDKKMTYDEFIIKHEITMVAKLIGVIEKDNWDCLKYDVRLSKSNQYIDVSYHLGLGYIDLKKDIKILRYKTCFTGDEENMFYAWQHNPVAKFKDRKTFLSLAGKIARVQDVMPKLSNVLQSLADSARCYTDGMSFEDFCSCFGYDTDSRKAEKLYYEVQGEGMKVVKWLSKNVNDELLECQED